MNQRSALAKIQITQDITFSNSTIIAIKQGTLLQEKQDYTIMDKQKGKITKLTQAEFELDEDMQILLF